MDKNQSMETAGHKFGEPVLVSYQDLMGLFANTLASADICKTVICMQGIYRMGKKLYGNTFYDKLIDMTSMGEITLTMSPAIRAGLYNGDVIKVRGTLQPRKHVSEVSLILSVSQAERTNDDASRQYEKQCSDILLLKEANGRKNVKELLLGILRSGGKPRVALICSENSVAWSDFQDGIGTAAQKYDIQKCPVAFKNPSELCQRIREIDIGGICDVMAVTRGGGTGINELDDINVIKTFADLKTPWIYGAGHEDDRLFVRKVADADMPTPKGLAYYLRDIANEACGGNDDSSGIGSRAMAKEMAQMREANIKAKRRVLLLRCACAVLGILAAALLAVLAYIIV